LFILSIFNIIVFSWHLNKKSLNSIYSFQLFDVYILSIMHFFLCLDSVIPLQQERNRFRNENRVDFPLHLQLCRGQHRTMGSVSGTNVSDDSSRGPDSTFLCWRSRHLHLHYPLCIMAVSRVSAIS